VAQLTIRTIKRHPTKSALALAVHAFQHAQVGIWLTNIHRGWLSSLWHSSVAGRESARLALMALPQPPGQVVLPHSIARTSVAKVAHAICAGVGERDFAGNAIGGAGSTRASLAQLFRTSDFDGSAALDTLGVNADPKAVPLAACFLSAGTATEKVGATLAVLGMEKEPDMSFAVHSWLTAFGSVPISILDALNTQIGALCGGDDERDHQRVQQEFVNIVNGAALPIGKKISEAIEQLGFAGSTSAQGFTKGVAEICGGLLLDAPAAWIPLLPEVRGTIGLHTSTVGRQVVERFGRVQYEVGKATATMTAEAACELAVSLGCADQLLTARMCWLCDAGGSGGSGSGGGSGVWCRDFATMLIVLSSGHHDDKRHMILSLNGMTSVETSWSAVGSSRQLRRDQLFKAFRPLLLIAMDIAVTNLTLTLTHLFGLPESLIDMLLRSVKVRSMVFLEDICKQLSTPTNTVAHSQAKQKLFRWIDRLYASWLQLALHHFGAGGHGTGSCEPPSWAPYLRPDPVGFTAGASPLTRGFCAPVGMTTKDEDKLQTVSEGNW
jgi:hypothetical protein